MKKQRKHYVFMAIIMMLAALIGTLRFDMHEGYFWLIPCLLGFIGGVYIFAAVTTNH